MSGTSGTASARREHRGDQGTEANLPTMVAAQVFLVVGTSTIPAGMRLLPRSPQPR